MPNIIGIDPGLTGGIALIAKDKIEVHKMPVLQLKKGKIIDEHALCTRLETLAADMGSLLVVVEHVHAMPKQGTVSMFNFGLGFGLIRGILCGLKKRYILVRPQEWKREVLKGYPKGSEIQVARSLFPGVDLIQSKRARKPHSGIVDALLIAEYGRRKH